MDEDMKQLLRRIDVIYEFTKEKQYSVYEIDPELTGQRSQEIHQKRLE